VARYRGPLLKEVGVRARTWVQPGLGHAIPSEGVLGEALTWMEKAAAKRRQLAKKWPASRLEGGAAPGREAQAKALLAEARKKIEARATLYAGLMQAKGVSARWPDTAAGKEARALLMEHEERPEKPWQAEDVAEQRRFLVAQARGLDALATGPLDRKVYAKMRPSMLRGAIQLWEQVLADSPDSAAGKEAKKRLPVLRKMAGKE
jgi:hypothetical protein